MYTIMAFECEFCGFFSVDCDEMKMHEKECASNPIVKTCLTCVFEVNNVWGCSELNSPKDPSNFQNLIYNCPIWENSNEKIFY